MLAVGDGGLSPSILSSGDWLLWWLSSNGEGTDGSGGPRGSFWMVGSSQEASHRCDSEVGRWLGLGSIFTKIPHEGLPIYRGFDAHARGFSILTNQSQNQLQIAADKEKLERG
jgi:hypothetical protein